MWWSPASQDRLFLSAISAIVIVGSVGGCGADTQAVKRPATSGRMAIARSWAGVRGMMRSRAKAIGSAGPVTQPMPALPRDLASTGDRVVSLRNERSDGLGRVWSGAAVGRLRATAHTNRAARRLRIAQAWIAGASQHQSITLRQQHMRSTRPYLADVIDEPHAELSGAVPRSFIQMSHHRL